VSLAERLADGLVTEEERAYFIRFMHRGLLVEPFRGVKHVAGLDVGVTYPDSDDPNYRYTNALWEVQNALKKDIEWVYAGENSAEPLDRGIRVDIIRDIFGNPFRSYQLEQGWLAEGVMAVAEYIYQHSVFEHLPILADALEQAGCRTTDIIGHCRQAPFHVKGCWVVELLLGVINRNG
jgi:hypothetical protein